MGVRLVRIDDRLIHGQVVVGWGQPLDVRRIVLVDDTVAESVWEQDLYRMGVPPEMQLLFMDVPTAARELGTLLEQPESTIVLTGDVTTMLRLVREAAGIPEVNVGGLHYRTGRTQRLRYVFLTPQEEDELREMIACGVKVTAQDVPAARPVPMDEVLTKAAAESGR